MRYEAKLSVLKRVLRHRNFKNICYTVSKRHQHLLCYYLNCKSLLTKELVHGKCSAGTTIATCETELRDSIINHIIPSVDPQDLVYTTSWVDCKEMSVRLNMFVLLRIQGFYPVFGKIDSIYLVGTFYFVKLIVCETHHFDELYQSFVIKYTSIHEYLPIQQIPSQPVS